MDQYIDFPCLEVHQPIGVFYVGLLDSRDLVRISQSDMRELADEELDKYLGIQRRLSERRVSELKKYVNSLDPSFPNSVVLTVSSVDAMYDETSRKMQLNDAPHVAHVLDGQHRIEGLKYLEEGKVFQVIATIFVDMDIEDQALLFATINLAQTRVNKSLLYDLYEYAKYPSPQKTAHDIARLLNTREGSPFYQRIKILGTANAAQREKQVITQATFATSVANLISGNESKAIEDREALRESRPLPSVSSKQEEELIFRKKFLEGKDAEIALILWNYFGAIRDRWAIAWNQRRTNNILPKATGFKVFMRVLPNIFRVLADRDSNPSKEDFSRILDGIPLQDEDFAKPDYTESGGDQHLYKDLLQNIPEIVPE
ncbi:MAG: DGQHR domain-containing protein [Anaerolineae bacterium]